MKILGVIPARYSSTRFPGKPLVQILGKTMIQRVYEASSRVLDNVVVATDDERIFNEVEKFKGHVVMTSVHHKSGTDRIVEAMEKISHSSNFQPEVIINIQGDEPLLKAEHLNKICKCFSHPSVEIATLAKPIRTDEELFNPNYPKVVISKHSEALYFSRSVIPFLRNSAKKDWHSLHNYYKHIGIYGYRADILKEISILDVSGLEKAESLEQLRWLEHGFRIQVELTQIETPSVDTPQDLEKILEKFSNELFSE